VFRTEQPWGRGLQLGRYSRHDPTAHAGNPGPAQAPRPPGNTANRFTLDETWSPVLMVRGGMVALRGLAGSYLAHGTSEFGAGE